jgi:predicted DNA-binding transcriptional regulator YafY
VRPDFKFPALNLNEEELLEQAAAAAVTSSPGLCALGSSRTTLRKLAAVSDDKAARLLDEAGQLVGVLDLKLTDHRQHAEVIRTIQWALLKQKQLSGQYESPYRGRPKRVTVHPYRLCLVRQSWYLIACPANETNPKTYRVGRFKTLRMLDLDAAVPSDFDLHAYFGNAWAVMRRGREYDVRIRFAPAAAVQVSETKWHHTQKVTRHGDGSVTLVFRVDGLDEILWWLLGWSGFATVIEPVELKQRYIEQLRRGISVNCDRRAPG